MYACVNLSKKREISCSQYFSNKFYMVGFYVLLMIEEKNNFNNMFKLELIIINYL